MALNINKIPVPPQGRNKNFKYQSASGSSATSVTVNQGGGGVTNPALAFFEVRYVNDTPYVVCTLPLASEYDITAYSQNPEALPDLWSGMPLASDTVKGGIKYDPATLAINANGQLTVIGGGSGGVSSWNDLSDKPVWLALATLAQFEAGHGHAWDKITATPTTLGGYGITDAATSTHTHAFAEITSKPTTISGYGITDAYTKTNMQTSGGAQLHWNNLTNKPATFAPSAHTHVIADVTNLQTTLDGKAALNGSGSQNFATNNLSVAGNLTITGTITQVDTEIVKSTNDLIITRDGATTGLIAGTYTGIQATKYDGTNDGQLVFGADGFARVGDVGQLQILATREDTPLNAGIAYFDTATQRFLTKSEGSLSVYNSVYFNGLAVSDVYRKLGTKAAGEFYLGTTNPTNINRLNYDGYLYGTRLYSRGAEVVNESAVQSLSNKTLSSPTLTTPRFGTGGWIADSNGNELIKFPATVASAVNEITIGNAASGSNPYIYASGGDADVNLSIAGKGIGRVVVDGIASNFFVRSDAMGGGSAMDFNSSPNTALLTSVNANANTPFGSAWYNVVNIRHRGGITDGNQYGGQIAFGMTANVNKLAFRAQNAGVWQTWNEVVTTKQTTVVTLYSTNAQYYAPTLAFQENYSGADWPAATIKADYYGGIAASTGTLHGLHFISGRENLFSNFIFRNQTGIQLAVIDKDGNITASGEVTAYSDARLKTNVTTLQSVLTKIKQLRPVAYTKDEKRSIGLIAQEVQPWFPELVNTNGEYLSLNYAQLTAVLIKAVQEILKKIEKN